MTVAELVGRLEARKRPPRSSRDSMVAYRVHFLDNGLRVRRLQYMECHNDDEAIERLAGVDHRFIVELWQKKRLVWRFGVALTLESNVDNPRVMPDGAYGPAGRFQPFEAQQPRQEAGVAHDQSPSVNKALFVRLRAKSGKEAEVEAFLRDGLSAVMEEQDTTTWYAIRFGDSDFAIFDTFPGEQGRLAHLAGKVGRALIAKTPVLLDGMPQIEHARVLAFKLPDESGQVDD